MEIRFESARPEDADAVYRLLEENHLPIDGLSDHLATTIVARQDAQIVGSAAGISRGRAARRS